MKTKVYRSRNHGFSLIEMMIVVAIIAIPILAVGILAAGGSRSFQQTYDSIHKPIKEDAMATMTAFGTIGRKSNRSNYRVFKISSGVYTEAEPLLNEEIATGQAVEFRYWQQPFDPQNPGDDVLEVTNTGTHYALFYLDGDQLKADYGTVVNGLAGVQGGSRTTSNIINTVLLARDVNLSAGSEIFNHNVVGGTGMGSVRMNMVLTDDDADSVEIKTSVLLRMNWPR